MRTQSGDDVDDTVTICGAGACANAASLRRCFDVRRLMKLERSLSFFCGRKTPGQALGSSYTRILSCVQWRATKSDNDGYYDFAERQNV